MTADVVSLHPPVHISKPVNAALGKLASQLLPQAQQRLEALLETGEKLMGHMEELLAEARDERTPDYARDLATFKLTRARTEWSVTVHAAAHCIRQVELIRKHADLEPPFICAVVDALKREPAP